MASENIDSLNIQVNASATQANNGINQLIQTLGRLKTAISGTATGINRANTSLRTLSTTLNTLNGSQVNRLKSLTAALNQLKSYKATGFASTATGMKKLVDNLKALPADSFEKIKSVSDALSSLSTLSVGDFAKVTNAFKRFTDLIMKLDGAKFAAQMKAVTASMQQLANVMSTINPVTATAMASMMRMGGSASSAATGTDYLSDSVNYLKQSVQSIIPGIGTFLAVFGKIVATVRKIAVFIKRAFDTVVRVIRGVIQFFQKLGQTISNIFNKIKTVISNVAGAIKSIVSSIISTVGKVVGKVTELFHTRVSSNNGLIQSFTDIYTWGRTVYMVLSRLVNNISNFIDKSTDYNEMLNMFSVAMGSYAQEARDYAETLEEVMGIDSAEWMQNQGVFMNIVKGYGLAGDRAKIMSQQLTQIGYDLSSIWNEKVSVSMQKLQSAIAGEIEPVRRWGVDISNARLQADALTLGITKQVSAMNQAEKAQLRYYSIFKQVESQGVLGDLGKTLNSPANQLRIMNAQFTLLARTIGNIFIPILNKVIPYIIAVAKAIRRVAEAIASFFGYNLPEVSDFVDTTFGASEDAIDDVSDALGGATSAAKAYKNTITGIDEINPLNDKNASSGGGGAGGGGTDDGSDWDWELPEYDFMSRVVQQNVANIQEAINNLLNTDWNGVNTTVHNAMVGLADDFRDFIDGVPWDRIGATAGEAFSTLIEGLNTFAYEMNEVDATTGRNGWQQLGYDVGTGISSFIKNSKIEYLGTTFANKYNAIFDTIKGLVDKFNEVDPETGLNTWQTLGKKISDGLQLFLAKIDFTGTGETIRKSFSGVLQTMQTAITNFGKADKITGLTGWQKLGKGITDGLLSVFAPTDGTNILKDVVTAMQNLFDGVLKAMQSSINTFNTVGVDGKTGFQRLGANIADALAEVFSPSDGGTGILTKVSTAIRDLLVVVFGTLNSAVTEFGKHQYGSTGTMTGWEAIGEDISNALTTFFEGTTWLDDAKSALKSALVGALSVTTSVISQLQANGVFTNIGTNIATKLKGAFETGGLFDSAAKALGSALVGAFDIVGSFSNEMAKVFTEDGFSGNGWQHIGKKIGEKLAEALSSDEFKTAVGSIKDIAIGIFDALATAIETANENDELTNAIADIVDAIKDIFTSEEFKKSMKLIGKALWQGIWEGLTRPDYVDDDTGAVVEEVISNDWAELKINPVFNPINPSEFDFFSEEVQTELDKYHPSIKASLNASFTSGSGAIITGLAKATKSFASGIQGEFNKNGNKTSVTVDYKPSEAVSSYTSGKQTTFDKNPVKAKVDYAPYKTVKDYIDDKQSTGFDLVKNRLKASVDYSATKTVGTFVSDKQTGTNGFDSKRLKAKVDYSATQTAKEFRDKKQTDGFDKTSNHLKAIVDYKTATTASALKTSIQESLDQLDNPTIDIKAKLSWASKTGMKSLMLGLKAAKAITEAEYNSFVTGIDYLASGGIVDQGQLFVAREAGAEMVGSIGRKTGVANNEQITEGIATAVYQANQEEAALLREQNKLLRAMLDKDNSTVITTSQMTNAFDRQNRRTGKTVVPIG